MAKYLDDGIHVKDYDYSIEAARVINISNDLDEIKAIYADLDRLKRLATRRFDLIESQINP